MFDGNANMPHLSSGCLKDLTQVQKSSEPDKLWVIFSRDPSKKQKTKTKKEQSGTRTCGSLWKITCTFIDAFVHFQSHCFPTVLPSNCTGCSHTLNRDLMWQRMSVQVWLMIPNEYSKSQCFLFISKLGNSSLSLVTRIWFTLKFKLASKLIWLFTSFIHHQGLGRIYYNWYIGWWWWCCWHQDQAVLCTFILYIESFSLGGSGMVSLNINLHFGGSKLKK